MSEETKICTKCGRELPLSEFHKNKNKKDSLDAWCKECKKQCYAEHRAERIEKMKQWRTDNAEHIKEYDKQRHAEWYATLEGYAYCVRSRNLHIDREKGRCGKDEDPLPSLEYYIECFAEGIDYYDGKQYPFNEMGFDRIDNSKPHTIDNIVVATTFHNKDRWYKRMTVQEYKEYIQNEEQRA